jgi:endoribonuclease Dicer
MVHDVILASAIDSSPTSAARFASMFALNALEGDRDFMTQTCACRTHHPIKRMSKLKSDFEKALEAALAGDIPDSDDPEESATGGP